MRAAEAELRQQQQQHQQFQLVAQDASRPWLWLFKPTTVDKAGEDNAELPEIDGYRLQRASLPPYVPLVSLISTATNMIQANMQDASSPSI